MEHPVKLHLVRKKMLLLTVSVMCQSRPRVALEMQSQVNSRCRHVKPMAIKHLGRAFISPNALLIVHPSLCMSHREVLPDRRQRLLYQSRFTDDENDHLGDR